jgi:hypothetical protein
MKNAAVLLLGSLLLCGSNLVTAQNQTGWQDELGNHMAGTWALEGTIVGAKAHHVVVAEWILNHQFLRIQERTSPDAPQSEKHYEANWFVGYDDVSERYVAHLLDVFGARYSETLGYGIRTGDSIRFTFEYPDGPFHTTYTWSPEHGSWRWLMEQKDKNGKWTTFADLKLTRVSKP